MENQETWMLKMKWFPVANPVNPSAGAINIGVGADGIISIKHDEVGPIGNDYTLEAVEGVANNDPLAVTLTGTAILITLGKDGIGGISVTTNTAKLVAEAIDALDGINATYSGTGATPLGAVIAETALNGGKFGTPCPERNALVYVSPYFYRCVQEGNKDDVVWQRFTLATY